MFRFTDLRRYLLILALGLWVGGFTFYALFVLPSHDVLGARFVSGLVTRGVTIWLNRLGIVAIVLMLWDTLTSSRSTRRWLVAVMLVACLVVAVSHISLFIVHPKLDALIDAPGEQITNPTAFRFLHTVYERISGTQWVACLVFLWFSLLSWRRSDSTANAQSPGSESFESI